MKLSWKHLFDRNSPLRCFFSVIVAVVIIFIVIVSVARPKTKLYTVELAANEQVILDLSTTYKSSVEVSSSGSVTTYLVCFCNEFSDTKLSSLPKQLTTPVYVNLTRALSIYAGTIFTCQTKLSVRRI